MAMAGGLSEGLEIHNNKTLDEINNNATAMAGGLSEGLEIHNNKTLDEINNNAMATTGEFPESLQMHIKKTLNEMNNNVGEGSEVSHSDDQWAHNLSAQLSSVGLSEKDFFTGIFSYGYDEMSQVMPAYKVIASLLKEKRECTCQRSKGQS